MASVLKHFVLTGTERRQYLYIQILQVVARASSDSSFNLKAQILLLLNSDNYSVRTAEFFGASYRITWTICSSSND